MNSQDLKQRKLQQKASFDPKLLYSTKIVNLNAELIVHT